MEDCPHEEAIGKLKEFMDNTKGFKGTLFTIALAIVIQVASFLYLWGGLTTTVKATSDLLRDDIAPKTFENTRNIDRILTRLEYIITKQ